MRRERNQRYLDSLPIDRLLHTFRVTRDCRRRGQPVGGWEKPDCELRGHFSGHYLSACALMHAHAGRRLCGARGGSCPRRWPPCQKAIGNGYLGVYPEEQYDRLRTAGRSGRRSTRTTRSSPGHLDLYTLTGNTDALAVAEGMARWVRHWLNGVSDAHCSASCRPSTAA